MTAIIVAVATIVILYYSICITVTVIGIQCDISFLRCAKELNLKSKKLPTLPTLSGVSTLPTMPTLAQRSFKSSCLS